jgi:hypothetical protein
MGKISICKAIALETIRVFAAVRLGFGRGRMPSANPTKRAETSLTGVLLGLGHPIVSGLTPDVPAESFKKVWATSNGKKFKSWPKSRLKLPTPAEPS